jgi:hypothetical protein
MGGFMPPLLLVPLSFYYEGKRFVELLRNAFCAGYRIESGMAGKWRIFWERRGSFVDPGLRRDDGVVRLFILTAVYGLLRSARNDGKVLLRNAFMRWMPAFAGVTGVVVKTCNFQRLYPSLCLREMGE